MSGKKTYLITLMALSAALIGLCMVFSLSPPTDHVFLVSLGGLGAVIVLLLLFVANQPTDDGIVLVSPV